MKQYRIITNPPFDKGASISYWIQEKTPMFFGFFNRRRIIGDYKIDDTYGELGEMPFFYKRDAEERIKTLEQR